MTSHMLMSLSEFRDHPYTRDLHLVEIRLIEANVAAGNSVMICSCSTVILALEWAQVVGPDGAHAKHLRDVVTAREA